MIDKEELLSLDDKTLAQTIVSKGYVEGMLSTLIAPFADAVLNAPSADATIVHKNRYDAVIAFGNQILNRLNQDAEMVPPPAQNVQFDS